MREYRRVELIIGEQDNKQKQLKVQAIYRKKKEENSENQNTSKKEIYIVSIIIFLIIVISAFGSVQSFIIEID